MKNLVYENNNTFLCDSRAIAKLFSEEHAVILDEINNLITELKCNYIKDSYIKEDFLDYIFIFRNNKTGYWYEINHKAFSLLLRNFYGDCISWKILFDEAFEQIEYIKL